MGDRYVVPLVAKDRRGRKVIGQAELHDGNLAGARITDSNWRMIISPDISCYRIIYRQIGDEPPMPFEVLYIPPTFSSRGRLN